MPFPVDAPPSPTAAAAPSGPPRAPRIVAVNADGAGSIVTIDQGSERGVAVGWKGHLLDEHGAPVKGGELHVIRVGHDTADARCGLEASTARGYQHAEIGPP